MKQGDTDGYGFQTAEDDVAVAEPAASRGNTPPPVQPPVAAAAPMPDPKRPAAPGSVYLTQQLVNPRQPSDAGHVLASERYAWWTRNVGEFLARYLRNPTAGNLESLNDVLLQYRDVFVSGNVWVYDARH